MSSPPSLRTLVCEEVFDDNSQPSEEEVKDYAKSIGIDPDSEPHLLQYARDGLMRALPPSWKPCFDEDLQAYFYFNTKTGESQWEHPVDRDVRSLVKKVRSESISSAGEDDSKTSAKEDLKSFEEASLPTSAMLPKSDPLKPISGSLGFFKKGNIEMIPLKKSPSQTDASPFVASSPLTRNSRQKKPSLRSPGFSSGSREETESPTREDSSTGRDTSRASETGAVRKVFTSTKRRELSSSVSGHSGSWDGPRVYSNKVEMPSPTGRIDIDNMDLLGLTRQDSGGKKDRLSSAQEKHPRSMHGRAELTLTGGGSMFLKSRQKSDEKSPSGSPSVEIKPQIENILPQNKEDSIPKGILREQRGSVRQLWDIDPRDMSSEEKQLWRKQELEEERKSVRFNLDKDPDIRFNISESEMDEEDDGDDDDGDWNSDDEDGDEDRIVIGDFGDTAVLKVKDSSELDDISPKHDDGIVSGLDDKLETQMSKHSQDFTEDIEKSEDINVGLNPILLKSKIDIFGEKVSNAFSKIPPIGKGNKLKNVWIERKNDVSRRVASAKRIFEVQRVAEDINGHPEDISRKDTELSKERKSCEVLLDDNDMLSADIKDSQVKKSSDVDEDKKLVEKINPEKCQNLPSKNIPRHTGAEAKDRTDQVEESVEEAISQLKEENGKKILDIQQTFLVNEKRERSRLLEEFNQSMKNFEEELTVKQGEHEKNIREKVELSLKEFESKLLAERGLKYREMQQEFDEQCSQQRAELETKLNEEKMKLEEEFLEHVNEFKKALLDKQEQEKTFLLHTMEAELKSKKAEELEALLLEQKLKLEQQSEEKLTKIKEEHQLEEEIKINKLRESLQNEMDFKIANLRKELEEQNDAEILKLKDELTAETDRKREELLEAHKQTLAEFEERLKDDFERKKHLKEEELKEKQEANIAEDFVERRTILEQEHENIISELQQQHMIRLESYRTALRLEEEATRREHAEHLEEMKIRLQRELDMERQKVKSAQNDSQTESSRSYEKLRCEKRLLEDKYRSLKEKYNRLKTDVKISIERRKRRENSNTTGSENERSNSHKSNKPNMETRHTMEEDGNKPNGSEKTVKKHTVEFLVDNNNEAYVETNNKIKPNNSHVSKNLLNQLSPDVSLDQDSIQDEIADEDDISPPCIKRQSILTNNGESENMIQSCQKHQSLPLKSSDDVDRQRGSTRRRRWLFGRSKSASGTVSHHNDAEYQADLCSPIENLRRQLKKLEDLEDEFPHSTHTDTYLRYPFKDTDQFGSADLEFFRHRIHLERASIKRAKDLLHAQQNNFQVRLRDLKRHQVGDSTCVHPGLYQEERELADMEINLHHTRSMIGEKIIRLRHLEDTLHRATLSLAGILPRPADDQTLSDLSSHSESSGFSSTEHGPDIHQLPAESEYPESAKIIHSLENLNLEIREIWDALKRHERKHRDPGFAPPKLLHSDIAWPTLENLPSAHLRSRNVVQYPKVYRTQSTEDRIPDDFRMEEISLEERTRKLREWLTKARLYTSEQTNV